MGRAGLKTFLSGCVASHLVRIFSVAVAINLCGCATNEDGSPKSHSTEVVWTTELEPEAARKALIEMLVELEGKEIGASHVKGCLPELRSSPIEAIVPSDRRMADLAVESPQGPWPIKDQIRIGPVQCDLKKREFVIGMGGDKPGSYSAWDGEFTLSPQGTWKARITKWRPGKD